MFNPSRSEVRQFFFALWEKFRQHRPLEGAEATALEIVQHHPEYHAILENPEKYSTYEWTPEQGESNPFLHLSLHLALEEQLAMNQPPGIRDAVQHLANKLLDEHRARHEAIECLAEVIWRAQRAQSMPDTEEYLECLRRKGA